MRVSDAIAKALTDLGADTVFGVVGSGNFHVTNALIAHGARFVAARHECGAATMADAWARVTGRPGLVTLHQGPGITNALTGITEAAKSRTPMLVLAADVSARALTSNFRIDVAAITAAEAWHTAPQSRALKTRLALGSTRSDQRSGLPLNDLAPPVCPPRHFDAGSWTTARAGQSAW